jgi:hypothetical protein
MEIGSLFYWLIKAGESRVLRPVEPIAKGSEGWFRG